MAALRKLVPGLFARPTTSALAPLSINTELKVPVEIPSATRQLRGYALSIRSFKSKSKAHAVGAENRPPPPMPGRRRVHSFSGFLVDPHAGDADADEDEDETDAEMTAITREAVATALRLNQEYEFTPIDPDEIGVAL